jgi:[ribosomal protein S5]-alanine N-acetyltransferase
MIEGKRVYLKELISDDIDDLYFEWINDEEITRFMASRNTTYSISDLKQYVKTMNDSCDNYLFGIYLNDNNQYIGNIKVGNIDSSKTADIGIMIGERSVWGKGYATDAISCIVDYSVNILNLSKLLAGMLEINYGSYKAFMNNGFVGVEHTIKKVLFEGKLENTMRVEKRINEN